MGSIVESPSLWKQPHGNPNEDVATDRNLLLASLLASWRRTAVDAPRSIGHCLEI